MDNPLNKAKKICDECQSLYFAATSKMDNLCPDCSHNIYGYTNCNHQFVNEVCSKCGWNGQSSKFVKTLINE